MWVILLKPEQINDVYYLFNKIMLYLFYKMMFYNMILLMTGHYQNYALGKINAWSRVRSQSII